MKVELRINGKLHLELTPETPLERLMLADMVERAGKGKTVSMTAGGGEMADIAVEQ
jgi:hypothetical protein